MVCTGLSYGRFVYSGMELDREKIPLGEPLTLRAEVRNEGEVEAVEVVQLYVRDLVGQVMRPVRGIVEPTPTASGPAERAR